MVYGNLGQRVVGSPTCRGVTSVNQACFQRVIHLAACGFGACPVHWVHFNGCPVRLAPARRPPSRTVKGAVWPKPHEATRHSVHGKSLAD